MPDDPTGPDLQRIIGILFGQDETTKLFETIRPLDLPTDPDMFKARLAMASFDQTQRQLDDFMKGIPSLSAYLNQPPAHDPSPIERYVKDEERRKWQDSENLARIAQALERDPKAVEAGTGQEPPQDVEQATTGRGRPFPVSEWLETLQAWTALFFNGYDRLASNRRITCDEFMETITRHHPTPIPSLCIRAWRDIPELHRKRDTHLPTKVIQDMAELERKASHWKGTGPALTVKAITRTLFSLFDPSPQTLTKDSFTKLLGGKSSKAIRAIWQVIPTTWKNEGRPTKNS